MKTAQEAEALGYKTFVNGENTLHSLIDMSTTPERHDVVVKLPNGDALDMRLLVSDEASLRFDFTYFGKKKTVAKTFGRKPSETTANMYSLVVANEENPSLLPPTSPGAQTEIDLTGMTEGAHTVSIKLPNDEGLTVCVIPFWSTDPTTGTLDIKYHGERETFLQGIETLSDSLYTIDFR